MVSSRRAVASPLIRPPPTSSSGRISSRPATRADGRVPQPHPASVAPHRHQLDPALEIGLAGCESISSNTESHVEGGVAGLARERPRNRLGALEAERSAREAIGWDGIERTGPSIGAHRASEDPPPEHQVRATVLDVGAEVEVAELGLGDPGAAEPERSAAVGEREGLAPEVGFDFSVHDAERRRAVESGGIDASHLAMKPVHGRRTPSHDRRALQLDRPRVQPGRELSGDQPAPRRSRGLDPHFALRRHPGIHARQIRQCERQRLQPDVEPLRDPGIVEVPGQHDPPGDFAAMTLDAEGIEPDLFSGGGAAGREVEPERRVAGRCDRGV